MATKLSRTNFDSTVDGRYTDQQNGEIGYEDGADSHKDLAASAVFKIDDSVKHESTTNTGNQYSVTLDYPSVLTGNHIFGLRINAENTGNTTLVITPTGGSALAEKSLVDSNGVEFPSGELKVGQHRVFTYDTTNDEFREIGRPTPGAAQTDWTPTITWLGGDTGITYSSQEGLYFELGNMCFFNCTISVSAKGSNSGQLRINLPKASSNALTNQVASAVRLNNMNGSLIDSPLVGFIVGSGNSYMAIASQANNAAGVTVTDTDLDSTFTVYASGMYFT